MSGVFVRVGALAVAAVAAVGAVVAGGSGDGPAPVPRDAIRVSVGATTHGRPIQPGFVGFSIEYPAALDLFGADVADPDRPFERLIRNLTPGQRPVLRIGGDTADWTWWPTPGVRRPRGIKYSVTRRWLTAVRAGAAALNAKMILDVNFEADNARITGLEARVFRSAFGSHLLAGLELGNEPEVYGTLGWYATSPGHPVTGRPPNYDFNAYLRDYARIERVLPRDVPVVGPASGGSVWLANLDRYLLANPRVRIVTFHRYPLHRCFVGPRAPTYPTIPHLLAPIASSGPADSLAAAVAVAHAHGVPFRSDELNSVSCGGGAGVSDRFAAALWGLDTLFHMAAVGVDGVNIHTFWNAVYEPFGFARAGTTWSAQVKPLYYGLYAFTQAAPAGSRLLTTSEPADPALRVWATRAAGGTVRAVLINDRLSGGRTFAVRLPVAAGATARLIRLHAPSVRSADNITFAGQSFGATGALTGSPQAESVSASAGRRYVIEVPPGSAAMLTVSR